MYEGSSMPPTASSMPRINAPHQCPLAMARSSSGVCCALLWLTSPIGRWPCWCTCCAGLAPCEVLHLCSQAVPVAVKIWLWPPPCSRARELCCRVD